MKIARFKIVFSFLAVCILYSAWMTGFTFKFSECRSFPNYNMLAMAFTNGHFYIEQTPPVDAIIKDDLVYVFSGPTPALLRIPVLLLTGKGIPTGLMIVLFCAGISTFFAMILMQLIEAFKIKGMRVISTITLNTFIFCGISLHMVTIPSIHHESICAAMFFMMVSIYILLKIRIHGHSNIGDAIFLGIALGLAVGSRFSYVYAAIAIGGFLIINLLKISDSVERINSVQIVSIVSGIGIVSIGLLLWYNYVRFGAFFDFGTAYIATPCREYFTTMGYFRYDHLPYNFWSFFFRLPQFVSVFPFVLLPRYLIQATSIGLGPYLLLNANELTVSVFFLMPILSLFFTPLFFKIDNDKYSFYLVFSVFIAQIFSLGFTIASIARYYYDFVPLMMIMAFMGIVLLKKRAKISNGMVGFLGAISLIISFSLPMNAILFYSKFINYQSPLLRIFF